jgi:hypothetical protein
MPISNITRTNTVDEWRIQTNLSANALNKIETGNYDKTAGSLNIACTAVLSITSTGIGLSVANNALVSGDFTVGRSIALGSEGAATGNLTVGANVFIYGRGAALFVANSAIVNVSIQATQSIRTNNFIANTDASITGTAQLGILTVNTNATVGTTLAVVGNTTVGNLVTANSVVGDNGRFSSNVVASHFVTVAGSLVADSARITSNATFGETTATTINATNARISGNANVAHVTATGSFVGTSARISGNATFSETTATTINATNARISGNANVAHVTASGSLVADSARITANATFGETTATTINTTNARISGNANVAHLTASASVVADSARITANANVAHIIASGSLVADNARIAANATFGETTATTINTTNARITGNANVAHVTASGSLVADSARITANATFGETTATTINTTNARISGNANVAHVTASGSLVADSARITANANVAHIIASGSLVADNARIAANATFGETTATTINATNARISGNANVAHLAASASVGADNLIITNDAGIGGTLRVTGNSVFGNVNTANMMYAGSLRTVGRADVGGAFTVGADASIDGKLTVGGDFVLSGDIVYDTDVLSISTITPVTTTGAAYYGVFRGNTSGGVTAHNMAPSAVIVNGRSYRVNSLGSTLLQWQARFSSLTQIPTVGQIIVATSSGALAGGGLVTDRDSDANAYIRWAASSNTWQIRDVFNSDVGTSYSKILTANLISDSLTSTSTDTFLSSSGAKSLKDSINTEISDRQTANTNLKNYVDVANTNMKNYVDVANTDLKNYTDATFLPKTGGTISSDLIISGSLTVSGTVTTINTEEINLADNEIVLNSNHITNVMPTQNAGIIVNRGSLANSPNVFIRYDEVDDYWVLRDNVGQFIIATTANVGSAIVQGQANVGAGIISANNNLKNYVDTTVTTANNNMKNYVDVAVAGKDNTDEITEGSTNKYYTDARARAAVDVAATFGAPLSYISSNGTFQHLNSGVTATGYGDSVNIPVFVVNATGHITSVTNTAIRAGTTSVTGIVQLTDTEGSTSTTTAATPNAVTTANTKMKNYVDTVVAGKDNTDEITEGSTNLYFTNARARAAVSASGSLSYSSSTGVFSYSTPNSDGISEGSTNLYFTNARARAAVSASGSLSYNSSTGVFSYTTPSTSGISEGTNLYYTDARARAAVGVAGSFGAPLSYISANGAFQHLNSGVSAGTFGTASVVPQITVNASGHVTSVSCTSISIASSAVSGLAASATTNALDASNISSGTLAAARLGTTGAPQFGSLGVGTAASGTTGEIRATGDITAGYTSDKRLKTNIEIIPNALEKVYSLDGVTFNWNELAEGKDITEREAGVIAQQIQSVLPEAIMTRDTGYLAVRYEKLIPLLIEAIKELRTEIEELKKK